ncbi:nuclear transport factor 2 family protein [Sphingomonas histidinilytica]|uniref:SnoaL-like domain-containing protein n=1 Tax=Rhizorhabdus histidinilytica TaxID=439228 RepID=A0A1T5EU90_9SPHN|nr:nuclear transport factor 2 family protein [Rhizorhabdus histidinilytica]MBO9376598.1 nuclear transport factor 2 family protein [Rhizorhabdus histidinilytica]SKB87359.1 SnoaL-like domain-containing protein [Rhizorhabdus histidinilytica]
MSASLDQESTDYIAITRLQAAYADMITRRAWDELPSIFCEGARIVVDRMDGTPLDLDGPAGLAAFVSKAIGHMDFFEFVILNTVIEIGDGEAHGRMYMCEIRHDAKAGQTMSYGLYRDHYRKQDGRWKFGDRRYRVMGRTQTTDYNIFPMAAADFAIGGQEAAR